MTASARADVLALAARIGSIYAHSLRALEHARSTLAALTRPMHSSVPKYAVPPITFPFRALASYAGRAPLGRGREVALACLMAARLSAPGLGGPLPAPVRTARAAGASRWFASLALPAALRAPLVRVANASARESIAELAEALGDVIVASRKHLDAPSIAELDGLVQRLGGAQP